MKDLKSALILFFVLTVITGVVYPFSIELAARLFFPARVEGSLILSEGKILGSSLIGQEFKRPDYFWGRPSAVGNNPLPSGGSNLSGTSEALKKTIADRTKEGRSGDLLFASASGVDPDISPESATAQIDRVAAARKLDRGAVATLVGGAVQDRTWGFLGEPRVNVLRLNLALDHLALDLNKDSR